MTLPQAVRPFVEFSALLRNRGFSIAPDQTIGFIEAIRQLGPRDISDIHAAGRAMLAVPPERMPEYDALFRAFFMGQAVAAPAAGDASDEVEIHEPKGGTREIDASDDLSEAGSEAVAAERLSRRQFARSEEDDALAGFRRDAPERLPRRRSYRRFAANRGDRLNMRRTLREAARYDGEVIRLHETRRKTRQRRVVLLVDVSGSMKELTDGSIRFAHALVRTADSAEAFTFGTRLTRITSALRLADAGGAMERVGGLVADFDGGTRIGDALDAFLSLPRFAGIARGAAVVILSDGLERGDPAEMVLAVQRLSRLAWRLDWLTPLAGDRDYQPRTEALRAARPWLDSLSDGSRLSSISSHVLNLARAA